MKYVGRGALANMHLVTPFCVPGAGVLTAACARLGPVTSAAHHVMISVYMVLCMCGDAVSQAAQSFLPGVVRGPFLHLPSQSASVASPAHYMLYISRAVAQAWICMVAVQ